MSPTRWASRSVEDGASPHGHVAGDAGHTQPVVTAFEPGPEASDRPERSDRDPRFAQPLDHALEIGRVLVRQNLPPMLDRVVGVAPQRFLPLRPGLVGATQVAVARGQQNAADVAVRLPGKSRFQRPHGIFEASEREQSLRHEVLVRGG